jgi:hypothetical protein
MYSRACKGKHGPHEIAGPADENSEGGCLLCSRIRVREANARYYAHLPQDAYMRHLTRNNRRRRDQADARDATLYAELGATPGMLDDLFRAHPPFAGGL